MSVARREYKGNAARTTLAARMALNAGTFLLTDGTNYPTGAGGTTFVIIIDGGTSREEHILCSSRSGTLVVVAGGGRGFDGTRPQSHPATALVEHQVSADDVNRLNRHAADVTQDDHTQYLNEGRHAPLIHTVSQPLEVGVGGVPVSTLRRNINFAGSSSGIESVADDATNQEVDVTLRGLVPEAFAPIAIDGPLSQTYGYIPGMSPVAVGTLSLLTGNIHYCPFVLRSALTLAENQLYNVAVITEVTAAVPLAQTLHIGIYRADTKRQPTELLAKGSIALAAGMTGGATATLNLPRLALTQGEYLVALCLVHPTNSTDVTFRYLEGSALEVHMTGLGADIELVRYRGDAGATAVDPLTDPGTPWGTAILDNGPGFFFPFVLSLVLNF